MSQQISGPDCGEQTIVSEGDILIKKLVQKQLSTNVNLKEYVSNYFTLTSSREISCDHFYIENWNIYNSEFKLGYCDHFNSKDNELHYLWKFVSSDDSILDKR